MAAAMAPCTTATARTALRESAMPNVIWLKVSNVRVENGSRLDVQVFGDSSDPTPTWWEVDKSSPGVSSVTLNTFTDALDKKKTVLVGLAQVGADLKVTCYRIQHV